MRIFAITGIGTDIGKTVVAAIVVEALQGDYWKPVQSGNLDSTDAQTVQKLISHPSSIIHPEAYLLQERLSPHHAARLDGLEIELDKIKCPAVKNSLIIEGAGGLMVPLNSTTLIIDMLAPWNPTVILVSKHYLGSINHTLLSVEALKSRGMKIGGLIFNGHENPDTESIIAQMTALPVIGRLEWEEHINQDTIKRYASLWKKQLQHL